MKALFDQGEAEYGPVDVLVNNAGVIKLSPFAQVTDEEFQRLIAVNLVAWQLIASMRPFRSFLAVNYENDRAEILKFAAKELALRPRDLGIRGRATADTAPPMLERSILTLPAAAAAQLSN